MKNFSHTIIINSVLLLITLYSCSTKEIPVVTTEEVTGITSMSAKTGGSITDDGGAEISEKGICINTTGNPTVRNQRTIDGSGSSSFTSNLILLAPDTYYYVRAYARNKAGTGYGDQKEFSTPPLTFGSAEDTEGNVYGTVTLGNQTWMTENLRTTTYNDNTPIPLVRSNGTWNRLSSAAYCWYDNDSLVNKPDYGALYNWYSVSTGKLCPTGWHVATDNDWTELTSFLGGEYVAGDKLKEAGDDHWMNNSNASDNLSGFTALPGGGRVNGNFTSIGIAGAWWTSTQNDSENALLRELDDRVIEVLRGSASKSFGLSVRCIKN